jgi:solute carrier family 35 protein F1/2
MATSNADAREIEQEHRVDYQDSKNNGIVSSDEYPSSGDTNGHDPSATVSRMASAKSWFGYIKTKQFWIVLFFGQVLSLCIVGTNTLSQELSLANANIPAFQTFFCYVTLCLIWTPITLYKIGFKGWGKMFVQHGWKYLILSFFDVEGNYFTVLGYRYTNILSAELINFWAIVIVVVCSFILLHVRYRPLAIAGIFVCVAGMGVLIASDKITHANDFPAENALKGDLFALLGATFYGFSNTLQEFLVSRRPLYEVVAMLSFWGIIINGTQAGIFDRTSFRNTEWTPAIGGYIAGYDILLVIFYSICPLVFRMGSAAFLNISLLTSNFWGAIIGIHVFGISVHWMYPVAFVLILVGLTVYFLWDSPMGDSAKPWLGENQERGVDGVGTARRRVEHGVVV